MKIIIYFNRLDKARFRDDLEAATRYFLSHGVPIEFDPIPLDKRGYTVTVEDFGSVGQRYSITGEEKLIDLKDLTALILDGKEFSRNKTPVSTCQQFPSGILITATAYPNGILTLKHEIMHMLGFIVKRMGYEYDDPMDVFYRDGNAMVYYKNDDPYATDGNFAEAWTRINPYLFLFKKTPMYKYFSQKEVDTFKLDPKLWAILDKARELAGTSFVLTSGLRTPAQNAAVGGKANSAHLKGLAVDIACTDSDKRTKMLRGLYNCGSPLFIEVANKHIHLDVDSSIHGLDRTISEDDD